MCGIFGYTGKARRDVVATTLKGLKKLEYRGYDSAGIAGLKGGKLLYCKEVGKISALEEQIALSGLSLDSAIAHTRWATHGKPNRINAHPHFNQAHSLAIVHNGIIENYADLRSTLEKTGVEFVSSTDTEVVAHLISAHYNGNLLEALQRTAQELKGAYAIALVHEDYPDCIFALAHQSPLAIGLGKHENFIASDSAAFAEYTEDVIFLANNEMAVIDSNGCEIFDVEKGRIEKAAQRLVYSAEEGSKGSFEHYTLKEIYEQPLTISSALFGRVFEEQGTAFIGEKAFEALDLLSIKRIVILACGSSWNAGCVAAYMIEENAGIPVQVEISSEFRYKNPIVLPATLVVAISQSGETADTLAAMRELQAKGAKVLALCNVATSTLAREADATLLLRAGPEIGVCSTKAFTSQLAVLSLVGLMFARMHRMDKLQGEKFCQALHQLPAQVEQLLEQAPHIAAIAKSFSHYENFFFLGRHYMYPTSLEGALKLKEIAYINANGYPAGEMKHGPIALINEKCPTLALCAHEATFSKMLSNLMEVKARSGRVIAIAKASQDVSSVADETIHIPDTIDALAPILATIATQLFAYYVAKERGAEIDQPRNLAKSVTVE